MEKLDAYLTIREAAEFLGVSTNTLRNWGRDGKVPMYRNPANRYRLFKKSDLRNFLKKVSNTRRENASSRNRAK